MTPSTYLATLTDGMIGNVIPKLSKFNVALSDKGMNQR